MGHYAINATSQKWKKYLYFEDHRSVRLFYNHIQQALNINYSYQRRLIYGKNCKENINNSFSMFSVLLKI